MISLSGITISEYIRRRRLTLAASELKDQQVKVIDIAIKYGYQSPNAFSRAFQIFSGVVHVSINYSENAEGKGTFNQYIGAITTKEASDDYSTVEIPSLLWLVFEVEGDWKQVEAHWQRIYSEWLPSSAYTLAEGPEMIASNDHKSEIWISIKKKA